jgi:hypothetical protein
VKAVALVAVPPGVVTLTRPEVAPTGTANVKLVAFSMVYTATGAPLSVTAVAPVRLVPVTVTRVPIGPLAGVKLTSVGVGVTTVKLTPGEVPPPGAGLSTTTA